MIVCLCIFVVGLLFSLCCFAVSIYTLILCTNLSKELYISKVEIEKTISQKMGLLEDTNLEPGIYMPNKDTVTGEMGYKKVDPSDWLQQPRNANEEELIQSILELTGESNGR